MYRETEFTKYRTLIGILFELLREKKVSASNLARKFSVSPRTIYRYLDDLSVAGVPVYVERGRYGGICVPQKYKLPTGFLTEDEYGAIIDSLQAMSAELSDPRYEKALSKLCEQVRNERFDRTISGTILVDGTAWGDVYSFSDTLSNLENAVENRLVGEIVYISRSGERTRRTIEPHLLVLKENIWYVYAFCRLRKDFRLFKINRISSLTFTGTRFERREVDKSSINLKLRNPSPPVKVSLAVTQSALSELIEWLGIENVDEENFTAEATLPDDEQLVEKLLGFGTKVKVLSPLSVRERVIEKAQALLSSYRS